MSTEFLFRRMRSVVDDLSLLDPQLKDADVFELFEPEDLVASVGFASMSTSRIQITVPGPTKEAPQAQLVISERFKTVPPHHLVYYRYEICWRYSIEVERHFDDNFHGLIAELRRSIRFDHDPSQDLATHPLYHWHPNGSEFRFPTPKMTPVRVGLLAYLSFQPDRFAQFAEDDRLSAHCQAVRTHFHHPPAAE
jgi:hypothetical protein